MHYDEIIGCTNGQQPNHHSQDDHEKGFRMAQVWQHTFDFTQDDYGWIPTQGSHSGSGWVHSDLTQGSCKYRGINLDYTLPRPALITKIVATYSYVGGTAVCDPSAKNSTIKLTRNASSVTDTMNWGSDGTVTHTWDNLNQTTDSLNIKAQCEIISTTIHTVDAMANATGLGTNSGISVVAGQKIELSASASDTWYYYPGYTGPTGVPPAVYNGQYIFRVQGVNAWCLVGHFGDNVTASPWFYIGTGVQKTVASGISGNIYLGMNDGEGAYGPNSGSIAVTIKELFNNGSLTLQSLTIYGKGLSPFEYPAPNHEGSSSCPICYDANDARAFLRPISIRNGEKREEVTDLTINSPSGGLAFTRAYRQSTQGTNQYMGLGWTHNHAIAIDDSVTNKLLVRLGNGGVAHFTQDGTTDTYNGDPGSVSVIDAGGSGASKYTLTASDKSEYVFDDTGRLRSRILPNGENIVYTYYTSGHADGLLQEVTDAYGRKLQFTYIDNSSGFDHKQLWRVGDTDAADLDTSTPTGRYVEFGYTPEKLNGTTISTPKALLHTIRDVRGAVWTYDYYGAEVGESTANKANFLVRYFSPTVDMTGDGTADGSIAIKDLTYTLNGSNVITNITQKLGGVSGTYLLETAYAFQPSGQNITTEVIAGKTTTHYFAGGVYAGAEDAGGNGNFSGMNSQYRPIGVQDANGNVTEMAWSGDGKSLNGVTDALGNETAFTYNTDDTLKDSTDATGRKTEYTYGVSGLRQPTKIVLKDGSTVLKHQEFTYDAKGRVLEERVIDPANGTTILQKVTRTYYTANGLLESITQYERTSTGSFVVDDSTTYTYDGAGRVIKTAKSSLFGNCQFTYTLYDEAGNVLATACGRENVTPPTTLSGMQALYNASDPVKKDTRVTLHVYDTLGRRYKTTSNAGMTIEQTTLTVYDALNRVIRTIANYKEGTTNPFTATHASFSHGAGNNENLVTDTAYNARGMVRKQTDPLGNVTLYGYDDAGRVIKTVQSAYTPTYNNDYVGTTPDPDLSDYSPVTTADKDLITTNTYDRAGNLVMTVDVLGNKHFTVYDALNRPIKTVRNAKSSATVTKEIGDVGYVAGDDPRSASYVISTAPDRDMTETTEYDALGRVIRTARLIENRPTAVWETSLYGYDVLGRQVKVIRNASNPTYNLATDPDLSAYSASSDVDKDIISTTTYDVDGRVLYPEDVNGNKTYMVYDGLGRQVKRILNYVSQGSSNPTDWMWDDADTRWEIGTNTEVAYGNNNDQNIIAETNYDSDGRVAWTRDMLGRRNYTVYDEAGRVIRQIANYVPTGSSDPKNWVWHDAAGRWEDGAGNIVPRGGNDENNLITDMIYDAQGRVYLTIDTRLRTAWTFDSGEVFDNGLMFD